MIWYADHQFVKSAHNKLVCTIATEAYTNPNAVARLIAELPDLLTQLHSIEELLHQLHEHGLPVKDDLRSIQDKLDVVTALLKEIKQT